MPTLRMSPPDPMAAWAATSSGLRRSATSSTGPGQLRFAFYGRTSTSRFQNPASSIGWQREAATDLIAGHGLITAEYIDVGCSRRLAWQVRPQAAALLKAIASPHRRFDAIVVGEYERAFTGRQLPRLPPHLAKYGVQMWLPEFDGPIRSGDPTHEAVMLLLGSQSKREVTRSRFRVLAAVRTQVLDQGRFQGGRPPYGYLLVDAGPHPNPVHAQWGRRLHRLEPDPVTALDVLWIFAQRAGRSLAAIARNLNDAGVPSPSSADPDRYPHRDDGPWTVQTVASILTNPRYTGRQIWNRQGRDRSDPVAGELGDHRWNPGGNGSSSLTSPIPGWSASGTSSPRKPSMPTPARHSRAAVMPSLGWWSARSADCTWSRTGPMAGPATAAGTATPAPAPSPPRIPRTSTRGKIGSSKRSCRT